MKRQVSILTTVTFLQLAWSSIIQAQAPDVAKMLELITNSADRICAVIAAKGGASSSEAKGALNVELSGLASRLVRAGVTGTGRIAGDEYQSTLLEQVSPLISESMKCKLQISQSLQAKLLLSLAPDIALDLKKPVPQVTFQCQERQVTAWLEAHGVYGVNFDPSVYDDDVNWIANGKPFRKTRSEIAKEQIDFSRVYPVQKYIPQTSSAAMVRGQCVLTQQLDVYKRRTNGKEEYGTVKVVFAIRTDANGPRIVEQQVVTNAAPSR